MCRLHYTSTLGMQHHPQIFRPKMGGHHDPNFPRTLLQDLPTFMDGGAAREVLLINFGEGR